jgi:uncharacterized membrane protein YdbT with pleckstrin-like domain
VTGEWLSLGTDESVTWNGRPKLTTALPGVATGVALLVGGGWLLAVASEAAAGTVLVLLGVVVGVASYLAVARTEYVLTDRAVYVRRGVVGVYVTESPLSKVQNSAFSQDALGTLFGYGTVTLEVAGGDDIRFRRIEDPESVRRLVDRATVDEIPGRLEQWHAVLAELRALRRVVES